MPKPKLLLSYGLHLPVWLLFLFLIASCGYSNPHTRMAEHDRDQDGTIRIFLDMWDNHTNLLGLQGHMEQSLIQALSKSNRYYLTQNKARADYILGGVIYSAEVPGLSYGLYDRALELRAEVKVGYSLRARQTGKVVLQKQKYIKRQNLSVGEDAINTRSNQDIALIELTNRVADDIEIQLFYLFTRDDIGTAGQELVPTDDIEQLD